MVGVVVIALLGVTVTVVGLQAQTREMTADRPSYDADAVQTVEGIVASVTREAEWMELTRSRTHRLRGTRAARLVRTRMAGLHILLDTPTGDIEVHVAPTEYLAANNFHVTEHEVMEVVGSRVTVNGEEIIVARSIAQDGQTLTVRDEDGTPRWSDQ